MEQMTDNRPQSSFRGHKPTPGRSKTKWANSYENTPRSYENKCLKEGRS